MEISVITPSFNQGKYIGRTIHSVINQSHKPFEYVIMDGGSSDETLSILNQYTGQLTWVSEADRGQSHAVNKGIAKTSGEIIGWLNSDDVYYPNVFKKVLDYFEAHPEIDVLYGRANYIDQHDKILFAYPTEPFNLTRIKSKCFISQPATFFRRRLIEKIGLIDEQLHFCMDYEFWLRLALSGARFNYYPEIFAGARVYPETKTSRYALEASLEAIQMLQKKIDYIPADWLLTYTSAIVKSSSNLHYPQLKFAIAVWKNLWKATGDYYQGVPRIVKWLNAQWAMMMRVARKFTD